MIKNKKMKRIYTILVAVLITTSVFAQTPQKMTYQAVVRDANSKLITNTQVGIEINLYQGSAMETLVYSETQTPTTNINGLLSIKIGGEIGFDTITWANGPYFLETKIDPDNSGNYTIIGTSQLLAVPYALHAKTAESVTGNINENDPIFTTWDKSTGISITESQITDLQHFTNVNETDPIYSAWDKSYNDLTNTPNITDTVNTILDTTTQFVRTENDPIFTTWDKSTGISITESQITDLQHFTNADETDPIYSAWDKSYNDLTNTPNITDTVNAILDTTTQFVRTEIDGDSTNEIQTISRSGLTVTLTSGGTYQDSINIYTAGDGIDIDNFVISEHKYKIGDFAQGGIVFWVDETGEHGLVCSKLNQNGGDVIRWYAGTNGNTQAKGDGPYAGKANTAIIIAAHVAIGDDNSTYAARACNELQITENGKTYGDWYLPSNSEEELMYQSKAIINAVATANGGDEFVEDYYWSSTEVSNNGAYSFHFGDGSSHNGGKSYEDHIRAIRAF